MPTNSPGRRQPPIRADLARVALAMLAVATLSACASSPGEGGSGLAIVGLSFENRSTSPINGIQLLVPETGNFVSCGFIAPGASCASGFPGVEYRGQTMQISWTQGGEEWNTGEITLQPDETVRQIGAAEVKVVVLAPGSAGAVLVTGSR